jgi:uncharacterized protein YbcI
MSGATTGRSVSPATEIDSRTTVTAALSNEMVHLYKEQFGRGPTSARAYFAGPDVIVVVLEHTLTPAERKLLEIGGHQRLRELRMVLQYGSVQQFCEPVERLTGRTVCSFHSSVDTLADGMALETFVLHAQGHPGPSRGTLREQPG